MTKIPGVFAPNGSGITQPELDSALQNLIVDKVHAESIELQRIGKTIAELGDTVETDDDFSAFNVAAYLKELDTYPAALEALRLRLSDRFEALQRDRERVAATITAAEPLSLSA